MSDQSIAIAIEGIDKFSAPAKRVAAMSEKMTKAFSFGVGEIKALNAQAKQASKLEKLSKSLGKTAQEMGDARKRTKALAQELADTENPSKKLTLSFEKAQSESARLSDRHKKQKRELSELKSELEKAGYAGRNFAQIQAEIGSKMASTNARLSKAAQLNTKLEAAQAKFDSKMQSAANVALIAHGARQFGQTVTGVFTNPVGQMRQVEKAKGELASLGMTDLQSVINQGRAITREFAGIATADFVRAAYDIKSGISSLSDVGVANMTASAAITAKATKADVGQMTSLFATAYGSFKDSLYRGMSDDEFGATFSAQLAASVQAFKTDGSKMQQAIQAMGSGLAASGVSMSDQLSALGLLQQKMEAGEAGTTLKAIERSAAVAQGRFEKMGVAIKTLDENGNMRSLPDLLESVQKAFGDKYTTETGAKLLEAFGSDEAVKFFKSLYGQQEALRSGADQLEKAAQQGMSYTKSMAKVLDANMDGRLTKMSQRWNDVMERIGYALVPALEKLLGVVEPVVSWISSFAEKYKTLTSAFVIGVAGLGGLALVFSAVMTAVSLTSISLSKLSLTLRKLRINSELAQVGAVPGKGKSRGGFMSSGGKKLGAAGLAMGGLMLADTLTSDASAKQKVIDTSEVIGGFGGMMAGAAAGAAIGSIVPGIGTAIGGLIGAGLSMAGGWAGAGLAKDIATMAVAPFDDRLEQQAQTQLAAAGQPRSQEGSKVVHNSPQFHITQLPGESAEDLAKRVVRLMEEEQMRSEYDVR